MQFSSVRPALPLSKIKHMNIHQLSVLFDERQDRLLMRVNTQEGHEVRLWLTRRIGLRLVKPLQVGIAKMESLNASIALTDPLAQAMLLELKQDDFLKNADLKTPFANQSTVFPLGTDPMVVTDITLHIQVKGGAHIVFQDAGDAHSAARSCTLQMQPQMVHGLMHLLRKAIDASQWNAPNPTLESLAADDRNAQDDPPGAGHAKRLYTH